jgi:hypothetical protein
MLENIRILLKLDHQKIIDDDTMITQIFYLANSKHYDTMVTSLKLEITMISSTKLSHEDVKKAHKNSACIYKAESHKRQKK